MILRNLHVRIFGNLTRRKYGTSPNSPTNRAWILVSCRHRCGNLDLGLMTALADRFLSSNSQSDLGNQSQPQDLTPSPNYDDLGHTGLSDMWYEHHKFKRACLLMLTLGDTHRQGAYKREHKAWPAERRQQNHNFEQPGTYHREKP